MSVKNSNQIHDLPACNTVFQPTELPRAPFVQVVQFYRNEAHSKFKIQQTLLFHRFIQCTRTLGSLFLKQDHYSFNYHLCGI